VTCTIMMLNEKADEEVEAILKWLFVPALPTNDDERIAVLIRRTPGQTCNTQGVIHPYSMRGHGTKVVTKEALYGASTFQVFYQEIARIT
jgi:hypothetical protein